MLVCVVAACVRLGDTAAAASSHAMLRDPQLQLVAALELGVLVQGGCELTPAGPGWRISTTCCTPWMARLQARGHQSAVVQLQQGLCLRHAEEHLSN
jgi:hypothetical protein